eukprot:scaffold31717_cov56-Attheya_sp.AAC.3
MGQKYAILVFIDDIYVKVADQFTGPIPEEIFNTPNLKKLLLSQNKLTGNYPKSMTTSLETIALNGNDLRAKFPEAIFELTNLAAINLGSNFLTGSIPMGLGQLSNLVFLILDDNDLSGNVPTELGKLKSLELLHLDLNEKLTGEIPPEICNLMEGGLNDLFVDCQIYDMTWESLET